MAEDNTNDLITKEDILSARQRIKNGPLTVFHTPCIEVNNDEKGLCMFDFGHSKTTLFLKLESMQNTRSFKIRGVSNQFQVHDVATSKKSFVTMSAGEFLCVTLSFMEKLENVLSFRQLRQGVFLRFENHGIDRKHRFDAGYSAA